MSPRKRALLATALAAGLASCGGDSTDNNNVSLLGTWTLTKFEFVNASNSTIKTDLIALGGSGTITFNANASWSSSLTVPGQGTLSASGTYTETATSLTIVTNDVPPETSVFAKGLSAHILTLTGGSTTFNFGTGDVPATLNVIATK